MTDNKRPMRRRTKRTLMPICERALWEKGPEASADRISDDEWPHFCHRLEHTISLADYRAVALFCDDVRNEMTEQANKGLKSVWSGHRRVLDISLFVESVGGDWSIYDGGAKEFNDKPWPQIDMQALGEYKDQILERCIQLSRLDIESIDRLAKAVLKQAQPNEEESGN